MCLLERQHLVDRTWQYLDISWRSWPTKQDDLKNGPTRSQRERTAAQDDPRRKAYPVVTDLAAFAELVPLDHGLCVINTLRGDGSIQSSVVNAGVLEHPLRGGQVVGLVATGGSRKLHNLRAEPRATIVARAGW